MTATAAHILLVGDEETTPGSAFLPLKGEGYRVTTTLTGEQALRRFAPENIDLILLHVELPDMDGLEVCRLLRERTTAPIIMLAGPSEELDKVLALETGADDYLTCDIVGPQELRSRVRAHLRRAEMLRTTLLQEKNILRTGELEVDLLKRTVILRGEDIELTYLEFELLKTLISHPGRVYTRPLLLELIWGDSDFRDARTIDVHIRHLREKLELVPKSPEFIFTVRNVGYKFREL